MVLRILHVTPSYLPAIRYGGPIWSVHGLAKAQAALGHHVEVYTTNLDGPNVSNVPVGERVDLDGVGVTYFPSPRFRRLFFAPDMGRMLKQNISSFDIVHTHSVFLWPTTAGAKAARRAKVPYIVSPRGMLWREVIEERSKWIKRLWIALFEKKNIQKAAAIHVTANLEADKMADIGLKLPRLVNLPNAVDQAVPYDSVELSTDVVSALEVETFFLSLGRLSWKKNNLALIRAMVDVPAAYAIIAGVEEDGHAGLLVDEIKKYGLEDRVRILARQISGDDKSALFERCTAFVLPSFSENFGNTVLEAMSYGKPVIVSREAGVVELVKRHNCGVVCGPDPDSIVASIVHIMSDIDEAKNMGQRGAIAARDNYSWANIGKQMCAAYKSL